MTLAVHMPGKNSRPEKETVKQLESLHVVRGREVSCMLKFFGLLPEKELAPEPEVEGSPRGLSEAKQLVGISLDGDREVVFVV